MLEKQDLTKKLKRIRLVVLDVDGVMTDGGLYIGATEEMKRYDTSDGAGLKYLMRNGIEVVFLTGRQSESVQRRAAELGVEHVRQKALKKLPVLKELLTELDVTSDEALYIGDDLVDLPPVRAAGVGVAVANASEDLKREADYVTQRSGGHGAVREVCELLLKAQGKWDSLVDSYREQTLT